jgi:hypothetical protein
MTDRTAVLPDQSRVPVPANVGAVWPPSKDMLDPNAYAVNVPNMMECITQPLFFYQSYPAAGPTAPLKFFGATAGQNLGSATLTAEDTNMQQGGTLPAPQKFLIQGIGFDYISGNAVSRFGAQAANGLLNDFYAVMKRGRPVLTIGSKSFFTETTLIQLPCAPTSAAWRRSRTPPRRRPRCRPTSLSATPRARSSRPSRCSSKLRRIST